MLLEKPVRLPVLENTPDLFALNKMPGLLGKPHPWFRDRRDVSSSIHDQISLGKGELERLHIEGAFIVYSPEPDVSGPILFAKHKSAADYLKNALGSDLFCFTYYLVTASRTDERSIECDLPITQDPIEPKAVISHKYGKKSSTRFNKINESDSLTLWRATTSLPRMDQIRLHAYEAGIPAVGENLYCHRKSQSEPIFKRQNKKPLARFSGVGLSLIQIDISRVFPEISNLEAKLSRPLSTLLVKSGLLCED